MAVVVTVGGSLDVVVVPVSEPAARAENTNAVANPRAAHATSAAATANRVFFTLAV